MVTLPSFAAFPRYIHTGPGPERTRPDLDRPEWTGHFPLSFFPRYINPGPNPDPNGWSLGIRWNGRGKPEGDITPRPDPVMNRTGWMDGWMDEGFGWAMGEQKGKEKEEQDVDATRSHPPFLYSHISPFFPTLPLYYRSHPSTIFLIPPIPPSTPPPTGDSLTHSVK